MLDEAKKFLKIIQVKNKQRIVNKKFDEEGLTDEVLEAQAEINAVKNEFDIVDESEVVYENFVQ